MTKILLTRHGHVDGINPKRFRGRAELPLTELGLKQATRLGVRIAAQWKPVAIYTSGLQRCVVTAGKIAVATGTAASVLEGLMDLDYGDWQGRVQDDVRKEAADLFAAWHTTPQLMRFPRGESLQELVARVAEALRSVLLRHPGETVVM